MLPLHLNLRCSFQQSSVSLGVQVKVVLRVSPMLSEGQSQPPVLRLDQSKKRVTVMEPISRSQPRATMTLDHDGKNLFKTFNVDAAFPQESSQVWCFLILHLHSYMRELVMQGRCSNGKTSFQVSFLHKHGCIHSQSDDLKTDRA